MYMLMYIMNFLQSFTTSSVLPKRSGSSFVSSAAIFTFERSKIKTATFFFFTLWTTFISALLPTCFGKSGYSPIVTNLIGRLDVLFALHYQVLLPLFEHFLWAFLQDFQVNLTKVIFNAVYICWSFDLVVIFEEFVMLGWHWQVIKWIFEGV